MTPSSDASRHAPGIGSAASSVPPARDYAGTVTADELPDLTTYDGVLFDLDGVLTPTAEVHMHAWETMFTELFTAWGITPPYTERDYFDYLA